MVQIPSPPDSAAMHFFWIALPVILTLGAGQVLTYFANKHRGDEKDKKHFQEERDKEQKFETLLENFNLHAHNEWRNEDSTGPLHAENIRFPKSSSGGDR
jgi:hypothetical protein